ncbi:MAG TPA: tail fiber domain-containing protein [Thermoanaerobaculia bacterium]|nr:tail fiber domain-containing protein [Thermoanaerobaculia bacterium]
MLTGRVLGCFVLSLAAGAAVVLGQSPTREPIRNWPAPPSWSPSGTDGRGTSGQQAGPSARSAALAATPGFALPFVGLTPCRIIDTRGNGFTGQFGPPALSAASPRSFSLTDQCGIPFGAAAVSLNVTVTNTQGPGFIVLYPEGSPRPVVSTLNYVAGQTVANAAVVPLGPLDGLSVVAGVSGTDLIIDTNGYYGSTSESASNLFMGFGAGNTTMAGLGNTGIGTSVLAGNNFGDGNTGVGNGALEFNADGDGNTAVGSQALQANTHGASNTAIGGAAMTYNTIGGANTALGAGALFGNRTGSQNTAIGYGAIAANPVDANNNTAVGNSALSQTTGGDNIAVGSFAGQQLTTGDHNIDIGNVGVAAEAATIRIGVQGTQTATYIAGIANAGVVGDPVYVASDGQLGLGPISSIRFKEDVHDIADASSGLLGLRPVSFRYKLEIDPSGLVQYGLLAEEVAKIYPDLVLCDAQGRPLTVRYPLLVPMLLNEVQKDRKEILDLKARLERLEAAALR